MLTTDEKGYIQFTCEWDPVDAIKYDRLQDLILWRQLLVKERLMGVDAAGVGFGNMSERVARSRSFVITATQTGHIEHLDASHFAIVSEYDIAENRVRCQGAIRASSESLSHAILYQADSDVGAVVHVHDAESWQRLIDRMPTTAVAAEAGTVEMANEINRLLMSTDLKNQKILVMGGHKDGLISFGRNIAEACAIMLTACRRDQPASETT